MKAFALVCINEEKEVVSNELFATLQEAQKKMNDEYDRELLEEGEPQYDSNGEFFAYDAVVLSACCEHNAYVELNNDYQYHWQIVDVEIPASILNLNA